MLGSFVSAAKQQDYLSSDDGAIDSIAYANVDAQLPYSIPAVLVIAKVAQLDSVDSPVNRDARLGVSNQATPLHENVLTVLGQVVANLVHGSIIVYKRIHCKLRLHLFMSRRRTGRDSQP